MSWYNDDSAFKTDENKYTRRFWMPNDSDRIITFVDGPTVMCQGQEIKTPFMYQEYQIKINGNWRNWFTRHPDPSHDILAQRGERAAKVAAFTVIDHSEYKSKDGSTHKDEVRLYVVKRSQPIWKQIEKLLARHGSLKGMSFEVSRMGDKSPGTGTMLQPVEAWAGFNDQIHKPYDYLEILAPKTADELEAILGPVQSEESGDHSWDAPSQGGGQAGWGATSKAPQSDWNGQPSQQASKPGWGSNSGSNMPF